MQKFDSQNLFQKLDIVHLSFFAGFIELHRIKYIKIRPIQGMLQWYTKPKKEGDNNPLSHYCHPNSSPP